MIEGRFPERVVEKAVERMLPRGPLGRQQLKNLRVYAGPEHPHAAQQPEALDIAALPARTHGIPDMAQTLQDLGALRGGEAPAQADAPVHVQKLDRTAAPTRPESARTRWPASG